MTEFIGAEFDTNRFEPLTAGCHFLAVACDARKVRGSGRTDGGDRTHTHLRELDFESSASANSATSAFVRRKLVTRLPRNASGKEWSREPGAGSRGPGVESREPEAANLGCCGEGGESADRILRLLNSCNS